MPELALLPAYMHSLLPVQAMLTLQVLGMSCCQSSHSASCLVMSGCVLHAGALKQVALECSPFFCFHHVNASEDSVGNVNLDCIAMHGGVDFSMNFSNLSHEFFAKPPWRTALTRLNLSPATAEVQLLHAASRAILLARCCSFQASMISSDCTAAYNLLTQPDRRDSVRATMPESGPLL